VPASINSAIPPYQSHATQNGVTPEHAGALPHSYADFYPPGKYNNPKNIQITSNPDNC
jgi:hypothetical protein